MLADPISDMIIRLKNAALSGGSTVILPYSGVKAEIAETLKAAGYLKSITKKGKKVKKLLELELAYTGKEPKIKGVARISKPSRRVYYKSKQIRSVRQGFGAGIYSTPQGILTDKQAREAKVGGEALFKIW